MKTKNIIKMNLEDFKEYIKKCEEKAFREGYKQACIDALKKELEKNEHEN